MKLVELLLTISNSPDAMWCSPSNSPIQEELTEAVEGFVGAVAAGDAAVACHSAVSADMLAKQALVESVLCKRY